MSGLTDAAIRGLVQPDRVHARVYTDPAVFDLEMERLFGRAWIFVGHTSQIPETGDYVMSRVGRHPVIVTRDEAGAVTVLHNRCPHRGNPVCLQQQGHVRFFQCGYHDWTFHTDGSLRSVPLTDGYADWEQRRQSWRLEPVARVADYRGFVFANLSAEGPDLLDFLGYMTSSLDDLVDRAPGGAVTVAGGGFRVLSHGNWKLQVENLNDLMHAGATHRSAVQAADSVTAPMAAHAVGTHRVEGLRANGAPLRRMDELGVSAFPRGHSFIGGLPRAPRAGAVMDAYRASLEASRGVEKAAAILAVDRHMNVIYPSVLTQGTWGYLKVVQPLAVDRTQTVVLALRLKGAPPELFHATIRALNNSNSPANFILPDDLDTYQRTQAVLRDADDFWIDFARGSGTETANDQGGQSGRGTHELSMRNAYKAWAEYLCETPA